MAFTPAAGFRLLHGGELLADYQYTPPTKPDPFLHLHFCGRCGVRAFTKGGVMPQFGGEFYAVNVACLDDATNEELAQAPIHFADGSHDQWQEKALETYL